MAVVTKYVSNPKIILFYLYSSSSVLKKQLSKDAAPVYVNDKSKKTEKIINGPCKENGFKQPSQKSIKPADKQIERIDPRPEFHPAVVKKSKTGKVILVPLFNP